MAKLVCNMNSHNNGPSLIANSGEMSLLNNLPGYLICMDRDNRINYYCNERTAYTIGYNKAQDAYGTQIENAPCKMSECADICILQNKQVMNERITLKVLDIHPYRNDEIKIIYSNKSPLVDKENNVIATIFQGFEMSHLDPYLISKIMNSDEKYFDKRSFHQRSYILSKSFFSQLTSRENECLYYLVRGKTSAQIGSILSISQRTAEKHISNIKTKLHCHTKADLIEKALNEGFINYIPERLFHNTHLNLSIIL